MAKPKPKSVKPAPAPTPQVEPPIGAERSIQTKWTAEAEQDLKALLLPTPTRVTLRNITNQVLNVLVVGSSGTARTVSIPVGLECSMLASEFGGPHAERLRLNGLLTIARH